MFNCEAPVHSEDYSVHFSFSVLLDFYECWHRKVCKDFHLQVGTNSAVSVEKNRLQTAQMTELQFV